MSFNTRREGLKTLFNVIRLSIAFLNLLFAGALAQNELQASDQTSSGHSSDSGKDTGLHKEAHKEHHEEEENEDDPRFPRMDPFLLYLYSKILLITILFGAAFAVLLAAAHKAAFGQRIRNVFLVN